MTEIKATIFIPTWFGEQYLDEVFRMVFSQKVDFNFEVLVYDTSSTDSTPKIIEKYAKKHKNLRYKTIKKEQFGHGKTRAEAARDAKGEIVVYLTQDATPAHDRWLHEMVKPFDISESIVGVVGKQEPRPKTFPLLKSEIRSVFRNLGVESGTTVYYLDDFAKTQAQYDEVCFYSDVNSAARRKFLTEVIEYKDVPYSEDQLFGRDLINAGYKKAYAARASVIHSNDMLLSEYKKRMFDEVVGLRSVGIEVTFPGKKAILKLLVRGVLRDWVRTVNDEQYSWKRKLYWLAVNPLFHIEKWRGFTAGTKVDITNKDAIAAYSLEAHRHKQNQVPSR